MTTEEIPLPPEPEDCIHGIWPASSCTMCRGITDDPPARIYSTELKVGKMTIARFQGLCKGCGAVTHEGSTMLKWDGENWVCQRCWKSSPDPLLNGQDNRNQR